MGWIKIITVFSSPNCFAVKHPFLVNLFGAIEASNNCKERVFPRNTFAQNLANKEPEIFFSNMLKGVFNLTLGVLNVWLLIISAMIRVTTWWMSILVVGEIGNCEGGCTYCNFLLRVLNFGLGRFVVTWGFQK